MTNYATIRTHKTELLDLINSVLKKEVQDKTVTIQGTISTEKFSRIEKAEWVKLVYKNGFVFSIRPAILSFGPVMMGGQPEDDMLMIEIDAQDGQRRNAKEVVTKWLEAVGGVYEDGFYGETKFIDVTRDGIIRMNEKPKTMRDYDTEILERAHQIIETQQKALNIYKESENRPEETYKITSKNQETIAIIETNETVSTDSLKMDVIYIGKTKLKLTESVWGIEKITKNER